MQMMFENLHQNLCSIGGQLPQQVIAGDPIAHFRRIIVSLIGTWNCLKIVFLPKNRILLCLQMFWSEIIVFTPELTQLNILRNALSLPRVGHSLKKHTISNRHMNIQKLVFV